MKYFKNAKMSKEAFKLNGCEDCICLMDCHERENPEDNEISCPEIDPDRWKKPWLFNDQIEFNNKLLKANGYLIIPKEKYKDPEE
jgi:hypothetical protein